MSKNRKLLYCSISDKAKVIKWAEEGAFAWENRSLKATELADPALGEAYHRFTYVIQGLCWFRGEAKAITDNMVINAVAIKHEENEIVINIKGARYVPESKCIVKIHLPAIFVSSYTEMYFAENCSISDKAKVIKWAEEGAFAWENRSLKATELADPALGEAYHRFTYVIQGLCWFRGEAKAITDNMVINAVAIKHEENEIVINIKGARYVPESKCIVKIHLPAIFVSSYTEMYFAEKKLDQLVQELELECFKYIDGCRAQQSLNFEEATEQAEEAKERAE